MMRKFLCFNIVSLIALITTILPVAAITPPQDPSNQARTVSNADVHKVIAEPGILDTKQLGITLWHDYGAFALYKVEPAAMASLSTLTQERLIVLGDANQVLISAYPFDTRRETFDRLPQSLRVEQVEGPALHLIQFVGPIKEAWLDSVRATGATPVHYIANYGYLVWADDEARIKLDVLAQQGNVMQFSAPYQPYFKLGNSLQERIQVGKPDEIVEVTIQMYDHPGKAATEDLIRQMVVGEHSPWTPILAYQNLEATVRVSDLETLARQPDIFWIGERFPRKLYDEVQDQILAGNFDAGQTGPASPGYLAFLSSHGFSTDPADYPIVDVTDDGIGNGSVNSGDYTLHELGNQTNPTRLQYVSYCTSETSGEGIGGHGHINTSIVGGYDPNESGGFPYEDPDGYLRGLGVSPYGRMAGTRIFDSSGYDVSNCGGTDTGVIKHSQDLGAQISTNSWGASVGGAYDTSSQAYDVGTRDADLTEAGNQEMIFFFAAGNDGSGSSTVGSPGSGKNIITVGASENDRPSDEDNSWTDGCGIGPTGADDAMDVIGFSSRGPVAGGRVKPEIIAPGTHIQGTASTNGSYDGSSVCDRYRPSGQTIFAASSGTSHSTPAAAGVGSLYYYWLEQEYNLTPSPAMIKAYLIAHPTYLTGVDANDALPSNDQGYGMPNLQLAFDDTERYLLDQTHLFDNTGETWTYQGGVSDSNRPVRIVLAYTDKAGISGSSNPEVNDLNLEVAVDGQTYLGNNFSGQWSITGGSADTDNNYEAVFLPTGTSGSVEITVTAFNIADDGVPNVGDGTDQDFAVVIYNVTNEDLGILNGTVTEDGTSDPIENALVAASNLTRTVNFSADATGFYSNTLPVGTYTVTAQAYGYNSAMVTGVDVISGSITTQNFVLTPATSYELSGHVTDANTGWGLFASVEIVPDGFPAQTFWTDPWTGAYSVTLTGDYTHTLNVAAWDGIPGYVPQSREINISSDTVEDFALDVDAAACNAPGYETSGGLAEGFEDTTFPPPGWTVYNADGAGQTWERRTANTHEGTGSARHYYGSQGYAEDGWLLTPPLNVPGASAELRFWDYNGDPSYYGKNSVLICTSDCDAPPTNYTEIQTWSSVQAVWREQIIDLSGYAGQMVRLAFRYEGTWAHYWYIDDVVVGSPTCTTPSGGLLAGSVYDANTSGALTGAEIRNSLDDVVTAQETPGDTPISEAFYVIYAPSGSQTFTATMSGYQETVVSNYPVQDGVTQGQDFFLSAGYPHIEPATLHATVYEGRSTTLPLTVSNTSASDAFDFRFTERDCGCQPSLLASGGPDAFGYIFADSNEADGPAYQWVDIAPTGTELFLGDEESSGPHPIGFSFNFYGTDYTELYIDSNGYLAFNNSNSYTNQCPLPNSDTPNDLIALMWDDLDPADTGDAVYYESFENCPYGTGACLVVQYENYHHYSYSPPGAIAGTFQAILFENGNILLQYEDTGAETGSGSTTGIENSAGNDGLTYPDSGSCNTISSLSNHLAICFAYPGNTPDCLTDVAWLSENPVTGTVPAGGYTVIDVTFDAGAVTQTGDYFASLQLTNDSPYAEIETPVTMTVIPNGTYISVGTGNWSAPDSWQGHPATPPTVNDNVFIVENSEITVDAAAFCNDLTVEAGARLNIDPPLQVHGVVTNDGRLHQEQSVAFGSVDFLMLDDGGGNTKYYGLTLAASGADMGNVAVDIYGNQTYATGNLTQTVMRKYEIAPQNPVNVVGTFYYRDAELNGNTSDTLNIYHYSGGGTWDQMSTLARGGSGEGRWVEGEIGPDYSPFVLKSPPEVPTAVDLTSLSGHSTLRVATLLVLGLLAAGMVVYRLRRPAK